MFTDFVKPEITYKSSDYTIVRGEGENIDKERVDVTFDIVDKYFGKLNIPKLSNGEYDTSGITVRIDDYDQTELNKAITKKISYVEDVKDPNTNAKIGEKYKLTITNLDTTKDGYMYSGYMSISFKKGIIQDESGNESRETTITIGKDEPNGSGNGEIIDVVDPVWYVKDTNIDEGLIKLRVKDKYLTQNTGKTSLDLTKDQILVEVNGDTSTAIVKTLEGPTVVKENEEYEYQLTLSNLAPIDGGYTTFTPTEPIIGDTAKYRNENGGNIKLIVQAGVATDQYGNTSKKQSLPIGDFDIVGPEVFYVKKISDIEHNKETLIFNVTDKNYDETKLITTDELSVFIDGIQVDDKISKKLGTLDTVDDLQIKPIKTVINGKTKVVGHQYKLELSGIIEDNTKFLSSGRKYREYSGNLKVVINPTASRDNRGNDINEEKKTIENFTDLIKPEVRYVYADSDISKENKTFTMTFDIIDKYYKNTNKALTKSNLKVTIGNNSNDSNSKIIDDEDKTLMVSDYYDEVNGTRKVIGKHYVLTISNLQKTQIKNGDKYLDYSGVINVIIPENVIEDTTGNQNNLTTITSGINIPEGSASDEKIVDVVEPFIEKIDSLTNISDKSATLDFRVSDKYFDTSTLTTNDMEVYIDGTRITSGVKLEKTSTETEKRTGEETVTIGINYKLTITGFESNINQIKVKIPKDKVKDKHNNFNKEKEFILYNVLKSAESEADPTSGFLGNTTIQRQNIYNVTFEKTISTSVYDYSTKQIIDTTRAWDVSAQGDQSIIAWYVDSEKKNGAYKVHIANNQTVKENLNYDIDSSEIYANQNSTQLFTYIGYSSKCTETEVITNLSRLNVSNVTNMYRMFRGTGYNAMTTLELGNNFDTSNVTNMSAMFEATGYKAMTSLNLGSSFSTSKVENMSAMFKQTGYTEMTVLSLGSQDETSKFNTSAVTNMSSMFESTGHEKLQNLKLGGNFNTSNVTDMSAMFKETGSNLMTSLEMGSKFNTINVTNMAEMFSGMKKLTTLNLSSNFNTTKVKYMNGMFQAVGSTAETVSSINLGSNFDTKNVLNMSNMFANTGSTAMTTLDLGDKFYTTNVTNMDNMFNGTGSGAMTLLDLGPAFTKIADTHNNMFTNTGKSGSAVIYATESIFQTTKAFKLSTSSTTTIAYTRGTINARYRTEWVRKAESTKVNIDPKDSKNSNITITLTGRTNQEAGTTYVSNLTSTLTVDQITLKLDGKTDTENEEFNRTVKKEIISTTSVDNSITKAKDVEVVLKISNLVNTRKDGKYYKEYSGNISAEIEQGTLADIYGNKNMEEESGTRANNKISEGTVQTNSKDAMFADVIKPEFTYVYADGDINHENKTLTTIFTVADKYRANTAFTKKADGTYDASSITVGIDDYNKTQLNKDITKTLTLESEETETISGKSIITKQTYKLVIGNLEQKGQNGISDGYTYSGYLSLSFPEGTITDMSGNKSPATTIAIGKNEPGGNDEDKEVVDVVDPVWSVEYINPDTGVIKLRIKDKYLTENTGKTKFELTKDNITVIVNGLTSTAIVKKVEGPNEIKANEEYEYILTLSEIESSDNSYTTFTPTEPIIGNTAQYRNENGGNIALSIEAGVVTDQYGNSTKKQELQLGNIDVTGPRIYYVQKTSDEENNKETLVFNVTDKNYDETKLITTDEISVFMDDVQIDDKIKKKLGTLTNADDLQIKPIKTIIDGSERIVGHQYKLELSEIKEKDDKFLETGRKYREYSGELKIVIKPEAARDKRGNNINNDTTEIKDFSDIVRPEVSYVYTTSDINKEDKTFTMTFDMIDKYYDSTKSTSLQSSDLTISIDGKTPGKDINVSLSNPTPIEENVIYAENGTLKQGNKVIGERYVLTISNLEQLQIKEGDKYLDYSGAITVGIPEAKTKDTLGNPNVVTTRTSGISLPGGSASDEEIVDVVDPYIEKVSSTVDRKNKTATIQFQVTDKYWDKSELTKADISVLAGTEDITSKITKGDFTSEPLKESKTVNGENKQVQYGIKYTFTFSGYDSNTKQLKIRIPQGKVTDKFQNKNKQTDITIYTVLKQTDTEAEATSGFLGNTKIQRQNVYNVTFDRVISSSVYNHDEERITDTTRAWDVSEQGDQSIVAWYVNSEIKNGAYKIHIASNVAKRDREDISKSEIFANQNSTYLFNYIGYSTKCTTEEIITNLNLLNTVGVTNMKGMFQATGYNAMKTLDLSGLNTNSVGNMEGMFKETGYKNMTSLTLGGKFNTAGVTNMISMFEATGHDKMETLNLGDFKTTSVTDMSSMFKETGYKVMTALNLSFDTGNVTKMNNMFEATGYEAMETLNLGVNFNTIKVTEMTAMFKGTGHEAMKTLKLGSQFNTSKVTNMSSMFEETGYTLMETLNLGENFDTTSVENMSKMFKKTGYTKMLSLDLRDKFYTKSVTDTSEMFDNTGAQLMEVLDLGPLFEKIPTNSNNMFNNTGNINLTVYAPESIYANVKAFIVNRTRN